MLKQGQYQKMQQGLSPLQIQTIRLLELPVQELEQRIQKELEENPVLEEASDSEDSDEIESKNVSLSEYSPDDQTPSYKLYSNNQGDNINKPQYNTFSVKESFQQSLENQLGYSGLEGDDLKIASFLIGSLDGDGYLRRDSESLTDDISFRLNIETTPEKIDAILKVIQDFEPVGIGARDLRECLLLQIRAKSPSPERDLAEEILSSHFEEFTKKHFDKIKARLSIDDAALKAAQEEIIHLNPRPGGQIDDSYSEQTQQIIPDFVLEDKEGELLITMPKFSIPELKVNKRYADILLAASGKSTREGKEAASFVKQKLDSAKWFVEAIKQRHNTLNNTMNAIVDFQKEFFLSGDETKLKPMVLKNIAEKTHLDISTISRVVNSKYVQTNFGIYSLKYFFSEGLLNEKGEEVSTREIKKVLSESIGNEDKKKPLTDEELVDVLTAKGYKVARRTVAKYREQLGISIARLRKEI